MPLRSRARLALVIASLVAWSAPIASQSAPYGVGRAPTPAEIDAWSISVAPDGAGLPPGAGTVDEGRGVYDSRCARCHGALGHGGEAEALVGGEGTLAGDSPLKTVSSYWPYATTLFDYTRRAMPFDLPGTLTSDQVYAVVAYVLYLGGIVDEERTLNAATLPAIEMPNRHGFVADPRPDLP